MSSSGPGLSRPPVAKRLPSAESRLVKAGTARVNWKGCGTALITPFDEKGRIDFGALERFVNWQIDRGIDFLVPCGTTGESATLSGDERKAVTAAVVKAAAGRVPIVAGAGGNHTAKAVFWARDAAQAGADGILSVSPMYNKPGPEGLVRHYSALSEATDLPILVYNVPGRTGSDLDVWQDGNCVRGAWGRVPVDFCRDDKGDQPMQHWAGSSGEFTVTPAADMAVVSGYWNLDTGRTVSMSQDVRLGQGSQWDELRRNPALLAIAATAADLQAVHLRR